MVHAHNVSVREAKLARDTDRYNIYYQHKTLLPATLLTSQWHKASYFGQHEIISLRDHDMTIGGITHNSTYAEPKASCFLKNQPEIQKSSTMKGSKSPF